MISSSKPNKICLAQPRSVFKTTPAYMEPRFKTPNKRYKMILASRWHETKTPSELDVIKFSSSLCLKYPRLQYLRYKKSQPPGGHNPA